METSYGVNEMQPTLSMITKYMAYMGQTGQWETSLFWVSGP